jgi:hypothetical protein
MTRFLTFPIIALSFLVTSCGDDSTAPSVLPLPEPGSFAATVTNQFFPLTPGTTFFYQNTNGVETNTVEVLDETKTILGITATVVHDQVFTDGELSEDTFDWYAQDGDGNVWYLGEDSREISNSQVVSTEGSWEAGVNGAEAGIIMWADPAAHVGEQYRQEFSKDVAEDLGKVVAVNQNVQVPFGSLAGCVKTEDRSAIESGVEDKFYCPGIGPALEAGAGTDHNELVDVAGP